MKKIGIGLLLLALCLGLAACEDDKFSVVSADILSQLEDTPQPMTAEMEEALTPLQTFSDGTLQEVEGSEFFETTDGHYVMERG